MNGAQFKAAIAAAGFTQASFALKMGVHRDTIGRLDADKEVPPYWSYALAGLIAGQAARAVTSIVDGIEVGRIVPVTKAEITT